MTIFLTVLKIIGIVLLALLCLILAVVLLVLFVPIRYRADGAYQEKLEAKVQVTWLMHLLAVRAAFDDGLSYSVKAAGIRLLPKAVRPPEDGESPEDSESPKDSESPEDSKSPEAAKSSKTGDSSKGGEFSGGDSTLKNSEESVSGKEEAQAAAATPGQKPEGESEAVLPHEGTAESVSEGADAKKADAEHSAAADSTQKQTLSDKVYAFFRKSEDKLEGICDKIKNVQETVSYYVRILEKEETKQAVSLVWKQLLKIIKHVLPRKMDICFVIGTGDPASTGQIMALQGMLYPILRERIRIVPDFEDKHVEGTFHIQGRITVLCLLACALRIIISKNFRRLIRLLRKKEEA